MTTARDRASAAFGAIPTIHRECRKVAIEGEVAPVKRPCRNAVRYDRDVAPTTTASTCRVTDGHRDRLGSRPCVPAVLEPELSAFVDLHRCRASNAAKIHAASPALIAVVLVSLDDRACVFGNALCDCLARYDPFGVPIVVAVLGAATGANDAKSRPLHPDQRLRRSKIAVKSRQCPSSHRCGSSASRSYSIILMSSFRTEAGRPPCPRARHI
jgi:hypothetical protein